MDVILNSERELVPIKELIYGAKGNYILCIYIHTYCECADEGMNSVAAAEHRGHRRVITNRLLEGHNEMTCRQSQSNFLLLLLNEMICM